MAWAAFWHGLMVVGIAWLWLFVTSAAAYGWQCLKGLADSIKTANQRAVVLMLVQAAEQKWSNEPGSHGAEKLQWVLEQLAARGMAVDIAQIEAGVFALAQEK